MQNIIWILCLSLLLNACSYFESNQENDRKATCKELKRRLIFNNGSSADERIATQQRAELATLLQSYRDHDCS